MRLLIVEDDSSLAALVRDGLGGEQFEIDIASDGAQGLERALKGAYDLILLDVGLPSTSGLDICRKLREEGLHTPVLMLTAMDTVAAKVRGLEVGADDYLTKPFDMEELRARIKALLRRQVDPAAIPVLQVADLVMDTGAHEVRRAGRAIELTAKEFAVLEYLMRHPGRVVTRPILHQQVWNLAGESPTNIVDVYIRRLRQKIDEGFENPLIRTVRGVGYQLKP